MSNTILIKRSGVANSVPSAANLSLGELAINYNDGNLFFKNSGGTVTLIASNQVMTVIGNITGGNLLTSGVVSAGGNVTGANLLTGGAVSATSTITGGNLATSGTTSATGNITGGNLITSGLATVTGNITGGNVLTSGLISATGNVTGGNINTTALVSAANVKISSLGNEQIAISSNGLLVGGIDLVWQFANARLWTTGLDSNGNITTSGLVSATGNVTGGNLLTGGLISSTGTITSSANITGGNILTAGQVSATGNVSGNYILGNGALLTGIDTSLISNGTSNIKVYNNGNAATSINGTSNVVVVANTGQYITGVLSATGTATVGNLDTGGTASATGNVTGGNLITSGLATVTGNITGGNVLTSGLISATGNVTGGNVNTNTIVGTGLTAKSTGDLNLSATGNIVVNSYINGLTDPVQNQDAATKAYVDSVAQGLDVKASVNLASTSNLSPYTYNNGTSGVGATLTAVANGALSLDSVAVTANARVLIKNEVGAFVNNTTQSAAFNGIYLVTQTGNATAPYILTRTTDFDNEGTAGQIPGAFTFVEAGSTEADTGWVCTTNSPVTMGSTQITFSQFSGAGTYTANTSAGLVLVGTVFNAKVDNDTTAFDGTGNIIVKTGANLVTPNIGAATGTSLSLTGNLTSGNANITGVQTVTGTITGGNLVTGGNVSATANITGGNILTGGLISATGNITGGNLTTTGTANVGTLNVTTFANIQSTTISTSSTTGAMVIAGGLGVAGNVYAGALYDNGTAVLTINSTVDGGTY
jgi:hypothetical protein